MKVSCARSSLNGASPNVSPMKKARTSDWYFLTRASKARLSPKTTTRATNDMSLVTIIAIHYRRTPYNRPEKHSFFTIAAMASATAAFSNRRARNNGLPDAVDGHESPYARKAVEPKRQEQSHEAEAYEKVFYALAP